LHSGSGNAKNVKTQQNKLTLTFPKPPSSGFFFLSKFNPPGFQRMQRLIRRRLRVRVRTPPLRRGIHNVSHTQPSPRTWEDRFDFYKVVSRTLTIPTFGIYGLVFGVQESNSFENALIQGSLYFFVGLFCGLIWEWVALIGLVYYMCKVVKK
jgi:hypothetical protein